MRQNYCILRHIQAPDRANFCRPHKGAHYRDAATFNNERRRIYRGDDVLRWYRIMEPPKHIRVCLFSFFDVKYRAYV